MIGLTGGLGTFGKVIFQFNIGLVIGAQFNANEHSSSSVNVVSLIILSTESLFLFIAYYFKYVFGLYFQKYIYLEQSCYLFTNCQFFYFKFIANK